MDLLWTDQLERSLLRQLAGCWSTHNRDYFSSTMREPVLALDDHPARLGSWHSSTRTLTMSRPMVRSQPWRVSIAVLKHEMAHQYVDEVLGVRDEGPHGVCFQKVCAERHIDGRARGMADVDDDVDGDSDRVMRRVHKLLALAASSNAHEAEAATNAAQRIMLEHNIATAATAQNYQTCALTEPTARLFGHERVLSGLLSKHFFVRVVLITSYMPNTAGTATYVEISGTKQNLAMAGWVHSFLQAAATRAFSLGLTEGRMKPKGRLRFLTGFMMGVGEKLARDNDRAQLQGLVWLGDPGLAHYVDQIHPRLRSSRISVPMDDAHRLGRAAGNEVIITKPIETTTSRGRLLG